jgi:PAS domain S-box-containing protein
MANKNTILYVDDNILNLEVFKALVEENYNVIIATDTTEAYQFLKEQEVKVLVSDQRMPGEMGLDFFQRIEPEFPNIIKILFTAYQDQDTILQAINQGGIFRYLIKPCNSKEIRMTIDHAIVEYDLRKENAKLLKELKTKNIELESALKQIQINEEKFRNIFDNSNDSIVIISDDTIIDANPSFCQTIGFNAEIYESKQLNPFVKKTYPSLIPKIKITTETNALNEIELLLPNTDKKYLELSNRYIELNNQKVILSIIRDVTERKLVDKKILNTIIKTQEEEQTKYAIELHDGLGPILSTLKMYIEWLSDKKNVVNKDKITEQSVRSINEAITIVKEIANNLSPHILQRFGLVNALKTYVEQLKTTLSTDINVLSNLTERVPSNVEIMLYRIILESLNNTIKHAQASKIIIQFKKVDNTLTITYSDNGKGFDVNNALKNSKGMGLENLNTRIKSIGGNIRIKSNIEIGTDIEIVLNL